MRSIAAIFAAALVLSGCQSLRDRLDGPQPNPGPCPNALSLYDAHRLVEFRGEERVLGNVGFTGEILNVVSDCAYTDDRATPIDLQLAAQFAFGRGAAAEGSEKTYYYFVAVTRTDDVVIEREVFPITVRFRAGPGPRGSDRGNQLDPDTARRADHVGRQFRSDHRLCPDARAD